MSINRSGSPELAPGDLMNLYQFIVFKIWYPINLS